MATAAVPASRTGSSGVVRRRVLMFPLPFQGHLNPMLQLAGALHERGGLDITVFHAAFNAPDPARHPPGYRFVPVGEGVPSADLVPSGVDADIPGALLRINRRLREPFRDRLRQALALPEDDGGEGGAPPACLVVDSNLRGMQLVAEELGVPTLVLRTGAAACLVAYLAFPALCDKGLLPPTSKDKSQLDIPLDGLTPLRLRDMVFSPTTTHANMTECLKCLVDATRSCSGVIFNTFRDLEDSDLQRIANGVVGVPIYPVGPLHKISPCTEDSLLAPDRACLEWLDKQEADSVLYVSFGSLARVDGKELLEIAWGLADSKMPFLWVLRHGLLVNSSSDDDDDDDDEVRRRLLLPGGFEEATRGRGVVVPWVPQQEVLRHRAVGGFWTHSGWNSTLESVCEGVPMMCRPQFADQMINTRYVQEVWRVGFELDGDQLERRKIAGAVTKLLCTEEGRRMRQRARDLRDKAIECVQEEGASKSAIQLLIDRIASF